MSSRLWTLLSKSFCPVLFLDEPETLLFSSLMIHVDWLRLERLTEDFCLFSSMDLD